VPADMGNALSLSLFGLLAALLLAACWFDVKSRTIPNELNLAIALLAIPFWWSVGLDLWPGVAIQVAIAAAVFGLFAIAFAIGAMGGGDVKLIGALALWLPFQALVLLLVVMSLAGGVLTAAMYVRHRLKAAEGQLEVPYGLAIAFGGLWLISERFLNQFG
jgi:prepilin peptidase CpaA